MRDGGKNLPGAYFSEGIFANAPSGELFQHCTCLSCGVRLKTFKAFKAHRQQGDCQDAGARPGWLEQQRVA
jgi:hypothetical protein